MLFQKLNLAIVSFIACLLNRKKCLFTLRNGVLVFPNDSLVDSELSSKLTNVKWLQQLTYLADIFPILNELNLLLKEISVTVLYPYD